MLDKKETIINQKIKNKRKKISFADGIVYYILSIVSVGLVILSCYLIIDLISKWGFYTELEEINNYVSIAIEVSLFTTIVIAVTIYERKNLVEKSRFK